jgi:ubiquinone/menaquinone biosynthesis C-methylase UbiE
VLDLGGGTGGYTKALLDRFPSGHVTLFDRPEVIELARDQLDVDRYGERLRLIGGDFLEEIPDGPFELVLIANVLHIFEPSVALRLVQRAAKVVEPGGSLVIRDGMVEPDRRSPEAALLFGIHMCVFSDEGRIYSTDEVAAMLEAASLVVTRTIRSPDDGEGAAIIGQKPRS